MAAKPKLYYFPVRGRAEIIRLALAAANVDFENVSVEGLDIKADRELFPFGQVPAFEDGDIKLAQSMAILRYIGRKYNLLGETEKDKVTVDMIVEGLVGIREKYIQMVFVHKMSNKDEYFATHVDRASASAKNGGVHFAYIEHLISKNSNSKFAVGSSLTIVDVMLMEVVSRHVELFGDQFKTLYPTLVVNAEFLSELPSIKEYRASPKHYPQ